MADKTSEDAIEGSIYHYTVASFTISGALFALEINRIKELIGSKNLKRLSNTKERLFVGEIRLHNVTLPVIDPTSLLFPEKSNEFSSSTMLLIVNIQDHIVGILIDGTTDLEIHVAPGGPKPPVPGLCFSDFLSGTLDTGLGTLNILNLEKLLRKDAKAALLPS